MLQLWNDRYAQAEFAFGTKPNVYFKEQLLKLKPGNILLPAEGEGRNAVYAAMQGWQVTAYDYSSSGKQKALQLAADNKVSIEYLVGEWPDMVVEPNSFDALALIYAHFPADVKSAYHKSFDKLLKPGGIVIFEAFSKNHVPYVMANEKVGGPKNIDVLFSKEEIIADFNNYDIIELVEQEVELNEGLFHVGVGMVVRFVGKKNGRNAFISIS
jgi:SAM-dependent methyltransferase